MSTVLAIGLAMLAETPIEAAEIAAAPIVYHIQFPDRKNHYADIVASYPTGGKDNIDLMMATWTPGSYLVREYARNVESVSAVDDARKVVQIEKTSKNRWRVSTGGSNHVHVSYRLYCREMSVRSNWVDAGYSLINGAPTFLTLVEKTKRTHRVTVDTPKEWKDVVTSLPPVDGKNHTFEAADFDELVDSPFLCGNPAIHKFEVGGKEHILANLHEDGLWDGKAAASDVAKIVQHHQQFWGVTPYPRYVFFNLITESGGGLEHDNNTVMMTSRFAYRVRKDYAKWLGLVSHEFFHTWNVRRLRPRALVEYDYENEVYIPTLWIAEGITSYYDDIGLIRSGVISEKEYFEAFSTTVQRVENAPGKNVQSLRDSSHDTWIKLYRRDENSDNSQISYYTKGSVVAFLLDAKIRRATDNKKSLDDAMRILYQRCVEQGYTPDDFRSIAEEVSGIDLSEFFKTNIDEASPPDYTEALEWFGLEFEPADSKSDKDDSDDDGKKDKTPWLGVTTTVTSGRLMISKVVRDSPAWKAGLNPQDELIAIGGFRVLPADFPARLKQYADDETQTFVVSRRGELKELAVTFAASPAETWKVRVLKDSTQDQKQRRAAWLGTK
ncbi:MAG: PDZ domain-containing protein [Planctomycetota bacterium]|nr:PDZ domain-containing protein [Planctomycetota bacterium]MDA1250687.1 PDZ domain-containing protein [Planctomycetota bacterium]